MRQMKRILTSVLAFLLLLESCTVIASAKEETLTVITATASADTPLAALAVEAEGLFCGWFTDEGAACSLNVEYAAAEGAVGTLYGAVLPFSGSEMQLLGMQMRIDTPNEVRFVAQVDRDLLSLIEGLHADNRCGVDGTLMPIEGAASAIGYGMDLMPEVQYLTALALSDDAALAGGNRVLGTHTYARDKNTISYTATVSDIETAALGDKIAARPYITYADANGIVRTVYHTEESTQSGVYAASVYALANLITADEQASEAVKSAAATLLTEYAGEETATLTRISALNTFSEAGSADGDNAYLELDYTTFTELSSATTGQSRYNNAYYTRIVKVKEDLYLLLYCYGQYGQHLYYVTSSDGVVWNPPQVLYNSSNNQFTYAEGSLAGTSDRYYAVNADACVLEDGTILCVYSRRPNKGYQTNEYTAMNTIELVRGNVVGQSIVWSSPVTIYHGHSWEPEIIQRSNGDIEVYWSHIAPMIDVYGFQEAKRSSGVGMIVSKDGGATWTPNVTADDTNHYAAKRIFQNSVGNMTINGESVRFFSGQMPGVVELYDGRLMLAVESEGMNKKMQICIAFSDENGVWSELGIDEVGPTTAMNDLFFGAAPSLERFDSGEVLLTFNYNGILYARVLNKEGTNASKAYATDFFDTSGSTKGFWASADIVDSHTAILTMSYTSKEDSSKRMIYVGKGRLNHTIDASAKNVIADGNTQEWSEITDALFVGSETRAQAAFRFAYDSENIYVAIDRFDKTPDAADAQYVILHNGSDYVKIQVGGDAELPEGVTYAAKEAKNGSVYEICINRAACGLADSDSFRVCPGVIDSENHSDDWIDGMKKTKESTFIKVNLQ